MITSTVQPEADEVRVPRRHGVVVAVVTQLIELRPIRTSSTSERHSATAVADGVSQAKLRYAYAPNQMLYASVRLRYCRPSVHIST